MKRMTEMRRWLAILLTVLLIAGALPYTALAEEAAAPEEHAGTMQWYSTAGSGKWIQDNYYYSDAWFREDPAMQNDSLALLSMQLTAAAVNGDENGPGASLLRELGFTKVGFSRMTSADPDDCSYTWGTKTIQENGEPCTLAVIAVQSFSEDQGLKSKAWRQNFTVNVADGSLIGASGDHAAFSRAADAVIDDIAALGGSGKVRYWITGHSRGGALAGLLAARLPQKLGSRSEGVYAYTFESPAVTDAAMAAAAQENCSYIHNYLCSDDLVAMVPPWGRERYGAICQMKTDEIDARLKKELKKLGSPAAKMDLMNTHEKKARELMTKLTETIPARADYSRRQTDVYQDENGQQKSITYVYQDAFCHLSDAVLSGSFGNLPTDQIFEHLEELAPVVDNMAAGSYMQAAQAFSAFAQNIGMDLPLTETDLYALLKALTPVLIDTSYEPKEGDNALIRIITYLTPALTLYDSVDGFTLSHQFDTMIGRLKALTGMQVEEAARREFSAGTVALTVKTSKGRSVRVSWNLNGTSQQTPTKYKVCRASSKNGKFQVVKVVKTRKLTGSWTDRSKKLRSAGKGKTYYYKVIAVKKVAGKMVSVGKNNVKKVRF